MPGLLPLVRRHNRSVVGQRPEHLVEDCIGPVRSDQTFEAVSSLSPDGSATVTVASPGDPAGCCAAGRQQLSLP